MIAFCEVKSLHKLAELRTNVHNFCDLFVCGYVTIVMFFITEGTFQVSNGTGWGKWEKWWDHNSYRSKCKNGYWIEWFSNECQT